MALIPLLVLGYAFPSSPATAAISALSPRYRNSRLQPGDREKAARLAVFHHPVRHQVELSPHHGRNPDLEGQARYDAAEFLGRHSDHRKLLAIHADRAADDSAVAVELPLPQAIAQDRHRVSALAVAVFVRRKDAAQHRLHPKHCEVVARNQLTPHPFDALAIAQAQRPRLGHRQAIQQGQVCAVVAVIFVRGGYILAARRQRLERGQRARVRHSRDRAQQHTVDPAEDGGIGRNPDRQREHRHQGKCRALERDANCIPKVLNYSAHSKSS